MMKPILLSSLFGACAISVAAAQVPTMQEPPFFQGLIDIDGLPTVDARIPANPLIVDMEAEGKVTGQYGGTMRMLFGRSRDTRLMTVYGYSRLVGFTPDLEIVPDVLDDLTVEEGRIFTLHLREGHKWSDGAPFTAEDFRYYWEDVALNPELAPSGPPVQMLVGGSPPEFEVIDEQTVRYTWPAPNPFFIPALAGASPLFIYRPAHYLKQFHIDYGDSGEIATMVEENQSRSWASLHNDLDNLHRQDNDDLPTLQPWILQSDELSDRYVFTRNPYYHRIDTAGHQLPYIDTVYVDIAAGDLIAAKTATGDSDLQARSLSLTDAPLLKQNEGERDYTMNLWRTGQGSRMAIIPNLNAADPVWREVLRDVRFRRALSMAVDRDDLNAALFFNMATPGANTILPASPLYEEAVANKWVTLDYDAANALLDEMGLAERNDEGVRLLPDGRPVVIVVETTGESSEHSDMLELIAESWRNIGVNIFIRPQEREALRNRIYSGETIMSVFNGLDNGIPTPDMSPWELAPTTQDQWQWPMWGQFYETKGGAGLAVDMPEAERLMELYLDWGETSSSEERAAIWKEMVEIYTNNVFTIGTVNQVPQPVVVSNRLHNVPVDGIYNWDPGAQFGMYRPDSFWME